MRRGSGLAWLVVWTGASCIGVTGSTPASSTEVVLQRRHVEVADGERVFLLGVPARCRQQASPLVLVLHRRGGSAEQAARDYGMRELAMAHGFVVAFPEAPAPWAWSAGGIPLGDARGDLEFLTAVIDTVMAELPIDPDRVYCCGHSSGGIMTYDLALFVPERLAAIGVVAGSIGGRAARRRGVPDGPAVPVMHVHGTADEQVPYDEAHAAGARWDLFVSAPDSVAAWARRNGCGAAVVTEDGAKALRTTRFPGGRSGGEVVLHTLVGGPHAWPQGLARAGQPAFDAAAELWAFFAARPRRRV